MSIASAISALQSASSDIASAITAKGVTVPSGSGFDDYASLIASIQTGGGGGGGSLPYDAEVEYIAANGTQYIDTGIVPIIGSTKVLFECQFTGNYNTTQILVGHAAGGGQWFGNVGSYYGVGSGGPQKSSVASSTRTPWILEFSSSSMLNASCGRSAIYYSGSVTATNTLKLFCGNLNFYSTAKIFFCRIYNGQSLILDLIPVRIGQVGQLYDKVNGAFYTNAGTGSFSYGSDV